MVLNCVACVIAFIAVSFYFRGSLSRIGSLMLGLSGGIGTCLIVAFVLLSQEVSRLEREAISQHSWGDEFMIKIFAILAFLVGSCSLIFALSVRSSLSYYDVSPMDDK